MNPLLLLVQNEYEKYWSIVKLAKYGLQSTSILYDENASDTHVILYELIKYCKLKSISNIEYIELDWLHTD